MSSYKSDGKVGPWAKEKLDSLAAYLHAFTKVFKNQDWCKGTIYIDAFAGSGISQLRQNGDPNQGVLSDEFEEQETYFSGSAKVALEISEKFDEYYFIEKDVARVKALQDIVKDLGMEERVRILRGDSSEEIIKILNDPKYNWRKYKGVVFLDPFAMQVEWKTIEQIAKTKSLEIILNFPVGMAIQRTLPRKFELADKQALKDYFGTEDWIDIVYEKKEDMFGESIEKRDDADRRLALWYKERLEKEFGFSSSPRLIRNTKNRPIYYLLWAGTHKKGKEILSHIFKQGEIVR